MRALILLLLAGCAHAGVCRSDCTPDVELAGAARACMDSTHGRLCGYRYNGDPCVYYVVRWSCDGDWEPIGRECANDDSM